MSERKIKMSLVAVRQGISNAKLYVIVCDEASRVQFCLFDSFNKRLLTREVSGLRGFS